MGASSPGVRIPPPPPNFSAKRRYLAPRRSFRLRQGYGGQAASSERRRAPPQPKKRGLKNETLARSATGKRRQAHGGQAASTERIVPDALRRGKLATSLKRVGDNALHRRAATAFLKPTYRMRNSPPQMASMINHPRPTPISIPNPNLRVRRTQAKMMAATGHREMLRKKSEIAGELRGADRFQRQLKKAFRSPGAIPRARPSQMARTFVSAFGG